MFLNQQSWSQWVSWITIDGSHWSRQYDRVIYRSGEFGACSTRHGSPPETCTYCYSIVSYPVALVWTLERWSLIYAVQESIPCDGGTKAQELLENHVSGKPSTKIERSGLGKASCNELMSMNCKRWSMSGTWIAIFSPGYWWQVGSWPCCASLDTDCRKRILFRNTVNFYSYTILTILTTIWSPSQL